jgi:hypothetical protein
VAGPIKAVDFDGVRAFHCGFFSISIDLEDRFVIGAKLAYILNALITRTFRKTAKSARVCSLELRSSDKIVRLAFKEVLNGTEN